MSSSSDFLELQNMNKVLRTWSSIIRKNKIKNNIRYIMSTLRPIDLGITESTINQVKIQSICWGKFKGQIPQNPPYYAHIFWNIDYRFYFNQPNSWKPTVVPRPYIAAKSWKRQQLTSNELLKHEYGHYLIGCLCALKFQEKVNKTASSFGSRQEAIQYCHKKFQQTLAEYLQIEKKYDDETEHYYNVSEQTKWETWIAEQINGMVPIRSKQSIQNTRASRSRSIRSANRTISTEERSRNKSAKKTSIQKTVDISVQEYKRQTSSSSRNIRIRKTSVSHPPLPPKAPTH